MSGNQYPQGRIRLGVRVVQINRKLVHRIYKRMGWDVSEPPPGNAKARWKPIRATRPNQVWETDITYVWCGPVEWLVLLYQRLGYLDQAMYIVPVRYAGHRGCSRGVAGGGRRKRQAGLLQADLQCDNGSQYAGKKFRNVASILGIILKFIQVHTIQQNGYMERFHGTLKIQYVWPHDFANYQEAETVISEAFCDYNQNRLHSAVWYVPPDEFLAS